MEKHNFLIVFVRGTPVGKVANISVVLIYNTFIKDLTSNRFKWFYLHVERAKCCGTHTSVDTVEVLHMTYLRETNAAIQTLLKCDRHRITIPCIAYHTMNKRFKCILELQMDKNINLFTQLKPFCEIINWDSLAFNRYVIPSLHLLKIKSKLQHSGEAEHQFKTIIKKIHLNKKLRETHSNNFIIRCSRSTKYVLLVIIVLWYATKANSADEVIQWKLMTKPVYFGKNVVLECIIHTAEKSAPMLWTKLPNGKTIAKNKCPADTEKYAVTVEYHESKMVYNLTIKHFNSTDINYVYRCDFGFDSYKGNILLNEQDFISEPSVREMKNFSLDNKKLHGIVMLDNGYPKPLCSGNFEGQDISKYISTSAVNVTCTYGIHKVLITQFVDTCTDLRKSNHTTVHIMLITLAGVVLVGVCLSVYRYRQCKQRRIPDSVPCTESNTDPFL
ncbi:unnamed protein product [Mytilus edulis]|uniref:Ig-like domain-containing protein n=1 Tax=Mytilus edulis TaxID=6550 RepID=A0A8S3Q1U9_MYTED|nr:unnamed protein product [Mytilus edulis]